jgi:cell wall-associated NlpC family hydrolase
VALGQRRRVIAAVTDGILPGMAIAAGAPSRGTTEHHRGESARAVGRSSRPNPSANPVGGKRKKGRTPLSHARMRLRALVLATMAIAITGTFATAAQAAPSSDLNKQITELANKLEDVTESYNALNISLQKTQNEEKQLAASLPGAKKAAEDATAQMGTMATAAYMQGNVGGMNAILNGPGDLIQRMSYIDQLSRDRQRDIDTYTSTTANYNTRQGALKTLEAKQAAQVKVQANTKKTIETQLKALKAKKAAATGYSTPGTSGNHLTAPNVSGKAGKAVAYAVAAYNRGATYVYATDGPNTYDCSGLTMASWRAAGVSLPHNARDQYSSLPHISRSSLAPGDLVFYRDLQHVAIYIGGGSIIAATEPGDPLKKQSVNVMPPYGYGRP